MGERSDVFTRSDLNGNQRHLIELIRFVNGRDSPRALMTISEPCPNQKHPLYREDVERGDQQYGMNSGNLQADAIYILW